MLVIKHRWFVPIFKVSTCSNLCAKVFPCDMTHFNICKPISWTATTMHKCINNIKSTSCSFNEHFIISPCFLYFNDIYMQQKLPPLQTPHWTITAFWNVNGNSNGTQNLTKSQIHFHFLLKIAKICRLTISVTMRWKNQYSSPRPSHSLWCLLALFPLHKNDCIALINC